MSPWLSALHTESLHGNADSRFDTTWRVHEDPRDYARLYWVTGGAGSITHDGARYELRPGHAYLVPPGRAMRSSVVRPISLRWVHVRLRTLGGINLAAVVDLPPMLAIADARAYDHEWTRYWRLLFQRKADEVFALDGRLRVLLAPFLALATPRSHDDRIACALAWAATRLEHPPAVAEMAAIAQLEPTAFAKAFRRRTGLPPATWMRRRRLEAAQVLLAQGSTLAQAAAQLSFSDGFHLSRLLKWARAMANRP
jgi:AraC-like DNA-binding protein/mannose-6-phosphate isomerase-like protein (cupin superfamily)